MKIIRITALWCPSCLVMKKVWDKTFTDIEVIDYDYDFDEEIVKQYEPGKILPVLIKIEDGKEVDRIIGEKKIEEIKEFLGV